MAAAIAGIEKVCGECNYTIIITQSQESTEREAECIETLFSGRVDGLLVSLAAGNGRTDHFGILHRAGIPVVFFDRTTDMRGSSAVVIDNEAAAYQMTSHLVSEGCRKFYFLGGSMKSPVYRERYSGFRRALTENGLPFSDDYYTETELTPHAGESGAMRIVSMRVKPDALFCSNDTSAAYAILTLMSEGVSIPSDIAVAGFNNDPISRVVRPELTTVSYPAYEVGTRAANLLIEKISGGKTKQSSRVVLDHEIIIRNSSKRR
jgi:LacI family transcriptional regulator